MRRWMWLSVASEVGRVRNGPREKAGSEIGALVGMSGTLQFSRAELDPILHNIMVIFPSNC